MLARHSVGYLFARGLPALINFATIAVFTRVLTPVEYGRYAVAIAWVLLLSTFVFDWLRLSTLRFFAANAHREREFLSVVLFAFVAVASVLGVAGGLVLFLLERSLDWRLGSLVLIISGLHGFHELSSELARARLRPASYGLLALIRNAGALIFGGLFAYYGLGGDGALIGLALALLVSALWSRSRQWAGSVPSNSESKLVRELASYGLPLTLSLVLHYVMSMSDRLVIERLLDTAAAGQYAVAYDLPRQSLGTLMMIVTLAGLPIAVRRMETEGITGASHQLHKNGGLLVAIALPAAVGLAILAHPIAALVIGSDFTETAAALIPLIACGVFLHGVKAYYVDHAFMLTKRVKGQVIAASFGAASNVGLNLVLIPRYGLYGAAYATVAAYGIALCVSVYLAQAQLPVRLPNDAIKSVAASAVMAVTLLVATPRATSALSLFGLVSLGFTCFVLCALSLDVAGSRHRLSARLRGGIRSGAPEDPR